MLSAANACERFVTQLLCMNEALITNDIAHCNTESTHVIVWIYYNNSNFRVINNKSNYLEKISQANLYEGWNFNSGNYLFTTDTK